MQLRLNMLTLVPRLVERVVHTHLHIQKVVNTHVQLLPMGHLHGVMESLLIVYFTTVVVLVQRVLVVPIDVMIRPMRWLSMVQVHSHTCMATSHWCMVDGCHTVRHHAQVCIHTVHPLNQRQP